MNWIVTIGVIVAAVAQVYVAVRVAIRWRHPSDTIGEPVTTVIMPDGVSYLVYHRKTGPGLVYVELSNSEVAGA